ncbi:uncharacterized protein [Macrobrachium rosenbergii]|uniref:uncharacterized protein n=1 Tax=Macrobrachium rosenbergii TaxID=79674 RepID=UPI0034D52973
MSVKFQNNLLVIGLILVLQNILRIKLTQLFLTNWRNLKLTASLDDKTTKLSDASQKIYEGTKVGSTASHMQVELIRSCMAEVLDDFEDDMNHRMMHLQFVVTKQYLQLKEMMEQLHNLHSLTHGLLTENERLQTENARLRCNF